MGFMLVSSLLLANAIASKLTTTNLDGHIIRRLAEDDKECELGAIWGNKERVTIYFFQNCRNAGTTRPFRVDHEILNFLGDDQDCAVDPWDTSRWMKLDCAPEHPNRVLGHIYNDDKCQNYVNSEYFVNGECVDHEDGYGYVIEWSTMKHRIVCPDIIPHGQDRVYMNIYADCSDDSLKVHPLETYISTYDVKKHDCQNDPFFAGIWIQFFCSKSHPNEVLVKYYGNDKCEKGTIKPDHELCFYYDDKECADGYIERTFQNGGCSMERGDDGGTFGLVLEWSVQKHRTECPDESLSVDIYCGVKDGFLKGKGKTVAKKGVESNCDCADVCSDYGGWNFNKKKKKCGCVDGQGSKITIKEGWFANFNN